MLWFDVEQACEDGYLAWEAEDGSYGFVNDDVSYFVETDRDLEFAQDYASNYILFFPEGDAYLRSELYLYTEEELMLDSVAFTLDGENFTFTGLYDPDNVTIYEDCVEQIMIISYCESNLGFINAVREQFYWQAIGDQTISVTLQGKEEMHSEIDGCFFGDLLGMYDAMVKYGDEFVYDGTELLTDYRNVLETVHVESVVKLARAGS